MPHHRKLSATPVRCLLVLALVFAVPGDDGHDLATGRPASADDVPPDFARPTRHFRVPRPADLSDAEAMTIYDRILDDMVAAYRLANEPVADEYPTWRRYNRAPYRSRTHGDRYINHYANAKAATYGRAGNIGTMPAGAVLVKDSFTVTARGGVFTGPLFVMEKMLPGFSHATRDWRYAMILPDGSLFGATNGDGHERVEFCASCHAAAGDANDHLFFVPEPYRVRFLTPTEGNRDARPERSRPHRR